MVPARRAGSHRYPRMARVNELLREVVAEEVSRAADVDERLGLLTVTAVECDPDLRTASVLFASLDDAEAEALAEIRVALQAAVSRQVRLKRTPLLRFTEDAAASAAQRIEDILRSLAPEPGTPTPRGGVD